MSKKSRRRNRKILATIAALGGAAMLANRRRDNSIAANEAKEAGFGTEKDFKETVVSTPVVVSTPTKTKTKTTIMDSMPKVGMKKNNIRPKNEKSIRVNDKGEVFTIAGAKQGQTRKVGNPQTAFVGDKYIYRDSKPYTKGRFGTFAAQKQMERGELPPQLRVPKIKNLYEGSLSGLAEGDFAAKKGGRATKSGFKRKGAAKRGFGRAFKGGK